MKSTSVNWLLIERKSLQWKNQCMKMADLASSGHLYVIRSRHSQSWPPMALPANILRSQQCSPTSAFIVHRSNKKDNSLCLLTTRFVYIVFSICEIAIRLNYTTHHFSGFYQFPSSLAHHLRVISSLRSSDHFTPIFKMNKNECSVATTGPPIWAILPNFSPPLSPLIH